MSKIKNSKAPKDWLEGLKQNFSSELISGFVVFLLALPLSLGIAKASGIPPIMGVISAIIGGLIVSFFTGSLLTIKGPAAGLIVIVAGVVTEFGGGIEGWKMAAGVMVVAGIIQVLFGLAKLGRFVDFFPLSAIHGMLAAIGLIIIAKQIPVLLNDDPMLSKGEGPFELFYDIPMFIQNMDPKASMIGLVSLGIMLIWPRVKIKGLSKIPAPLLVLIFAIPASKILDFANTQPEYTLVKVGNIFDYLSLNANFDGLAQTGVFIKYVVMLSLVGGLESLLTVKAIDLLDPYKRKSNMNKDLVAVGIGNTLAAIVGGYPMISEVARSSANVKNGAQTRWANFFHGLFMLIFVALAYPILEMIPNAALAAMLIAVGYNLAHPKEFLYMSKIGKDQLTIFLVTIFFTLQQDLLIGILAGIITKFLFHLSRGVKPAHLFKSHVTEVNNGDELVLTIEKSALFSNYLGINKKFKNIGSEVKKIKVIISDTVKVVDHSSIESLFQLQKDLRERSIDFTIEGLEELKGVSDHELATRVRKN